MDTQRELSLTTIMRRTVREVRQMLAAHFATRGKYTKGPAGQDLLHPRPKVCGIFHKRHWSEWVYPPRMVSYAGWSAWTIIFLVILYVSRVQWVPELMTPAPPAMWFLWVVPVHPVVLRVLAFFALWCILVCIFIPFAAIPGLIFYDLLCAINPELDGWEAERRKLVKEKEEKERKEAAQLQKASALSAQVVVGLGTQVQMLQESLKTMQSQMDQLRADKPKDKDKDA